MPVSMIVARKVSRSTITDAVADRLTFKCTLIETGSDSYRLQATEAEHQAND